MAKCEWLKMYGSDVVPGFPVVKLLLRTSREGLEKERKEKTTPYGVNLMPSIIPGCPACEGLHCGKV